MLSMISATWDFMGGGFAAVAVVFAVFLWELLLWWSDKESSSSSSKKARSRTSRNEFVVPGQLSLLQC